MPKKYDFTGAKIGNLTVVGIHGKDVAGNITWHCICNCGANTVVTSHRLISRKFTKCKCQEVCNEYEIVGDIAYVKMMTSEKIMICDAKEWEYLKKFHWNVGKKDGYAVAFVNGKTTPYHRLILKNKEGYVRDHINRNRLDNRRCNLRYATILANDLNKEAPKGSKSGYRGVIFDKRSGKWRAYISLHNKMKHIGYYDIQEDAIRARLEAEEKYFKPVIEKETHV